MANQTRLATLHLFISYRRSDALSAAHWLARDLKERLLDERVFIDVSDIPAGADWKRELRRRVGAADVVLVVIGPRWTAEAVRHEQDALAGDPDVLREEIETALRAGAAIIPVLVEEAKMPAAGELPLPFRPIAAMQAVELLPGEAWKQGIDTLVRLIPTAPRRSPPALPEPPARTLAASDVERIAADLLAGQVVMMLGSEFNAAEDDRETRNGAAPLLAFSELTDRLARFVPGTAPVPNLAWVAQQVSATSGRAPLCRELRQLIDAGGAPHFVHEFLAGLPWRLSALGTESAPMIVTTNYDSALERAFAGAGVPYDLAVFMAKGEHRGRFVHVPWSDPEHPQRATYWPITEPNGYIGFPVGEFGDLRRTVIVKLHGGAADLPGGPKLADNFVVTEDDYISYLTERSIEEFVPLQILNKIRESHLLFLAYPLREWPARVFLQRVWGGGRLGANSVAVDPAPQDAERRLWRDLGVDVIPDTLSSFVGAIDTALAQRAAA